MFKQVERPAKDCAAAEFEQDTDCVGWPVLNCKTCGSYEGSSCRLSRVQLTNALNSRHNLALSRGHPYYDVHQQSQKQFEFDKPVTQSSAESRRKTLNVVLGLLVFALGVVLGFIVATAD